MRIDMHKVICESPRGGQDWSRQFPRPKVPFDGLPKFQGIRRPHENRKWFGEHLGPLKRWLRSNTGRPWNDVYREACQVIKPDSVVRAHIKFHLLNMVERHTFMQAGEVRYYHGNTPAQIKDLRGGSCWPKFYVHPATGLLLEVPLKRHARWNDRQAELRAVTQRWLGPKRLLRQINGLWFECAVNPFPHNFSKGESPWRFDLAERRMVGGGQARNIYGRSVFCVAKWQLSRRELKRRGLSNSIGQSHPGTQSSAGCHRGFLTIAFPWTVACQIALRALQFIYSF
jgi:hypothetical protein